MVGPEPQASQVEPFQITELRIRLAERQARNSS